MVPSRLPLCSSHLSIHWRSVTEKKGHRFTTTSAPWLFPLLWILSPFLAASNLSHVKTISASRCHGSIRVHASISCLENSQDFLHTNRQSQQLCANVATSSLVKNSHTPSLANMKWPEPSSSSCGPTGAKLLHGFPPGGSKGCLLQLENLRLCDDTVAFVPDGRIQIVKPGHLHWVFVSARLHKIPKRSSEA